MCFLDVDVDASHCASALHGRLPLPDGDVCSGHDASEMVEAVDPSDSVSEPEEPDCPCEPEEPEEVPESTRRTRGERSERRPRRCRHRRTKPVFGTSVTVTSSPRRSTRAPTWEHSEVSSAKPLAGARTTERRPRMLWICMRSCWTGFVQSWYDVSGGKWIGANGHVSLCYLRWVAPLPQRTSSGTTT